MTANWYNWYMLPIILRTFATIIKLFIARCLYFGLKCTRMRLLAGLVYTCCSGFRVEWNWQKMQRREKGVLCPLLNINTLWFWTKKTNSFNGLFSRATQVTRWCNPRETAQVIRWWNPRETTRVTRWCNPCVTTQVTQLRPRLTFRLGYLSMP